MKTILILAANPRKDLSLDREIRDLQSVIEKSRDRQQFLVEKELAVRVEDLQEHLLKHRPQIVHFCGHGEGDEGLVFESDRGLEQRLRTDALSDLFRLFARDVECVLLNACYSEAQADAIVNHIDYVIGMRQTIQDNAAIAFSKGFYRALGYDCSIEESYDLGCNAIQLEISGSSIVRSSVSEQQRKLTVEQTVATTPIPEHLKPVLKKRAALMANFSEPPISSETRAAIQLDIDKSLEADSKTKQYRDRVREYLGDRTLSEFEKIRLNQLRRRLGLTEAEAEQILAEEFAPIQEARDDYADMLTQLIEQGHYPFNEATERELQQLCQELELSDAEVESITHPILKAERDRQLHRFQQDYSFVEDLGNGITLEIVAIPAGEFLMGTAESDRDTLIQEFTRHGVKQEDAEKWVATEMPQHRVKLSAFCMSKFPVTQAQYEAIMGSNPARFKGAKRPVENVSWNQATEFCTKLSQKTGKSYRLPSEAEWEYACRASTTTPFYFGDTITPDLVNCNVTKPYGNAPASIYLEQTTEVGSFPPNVFGLYDMHGNVWEWCLDHSHDNYQGAPIDGSAWVMGGVGEASLQENRRLLRGGSWHLYPRHCRSAARNRDSADNRHDSLGFRVVSSLARAL